MKSIKNIVFAIACVIMPTKIFAPDTVVPETNAQSIATIKAKTDYRQTLADLLAKPDKTSDDAAKKESLFGDDDDTSEIILPIENPTQAPTPLKSALKKPTDQVQPANTAKKSISFAELPEKSSPTNNLNPNRTESKKSVNLRNNLITTTTNTKYENNIIKHKVIISEDRSTGLTTTQTIDYNPNGDKSKSVTFITEPIKIMRAKEHEAPAPDKMPTENIIKTITTDYNDDGSIITSTIDRQNNITTTKIQEFDGSFTIMTTKPGKPTETQYFDEDGKETAAPTPKKEDQAVQSDDEKKAASDNSNIDDLLAKVTSGGEFKQKEKEFTEQQAKKAEIAQDAKTATDKAKTPAEKLAVVQKAISDCIAQFFAKFKPLERADYQLLVDDVSKEQPTAGSPVEKFIAWINSVLAKMTIYFGPAPKELSQEEEDPQDIVQKQADHENEKDSDSFDTRCL